MKKVKVTIYFPVTTTGTKEIELEIPDDVVVEDWIYENEIDIIEREIPSLDDVLTAIDFGYAGIRGFVEIS